ncbi:MAG: type I-A CRISPR-associated protein Cas5a [Desulfurococcales archaeon]|nr:type I-A CRISPR-associated protein Cas5a [Desulfurococcales archaeon]
MGVEGLVGLTATIELGWGLSINYYHSTRGRQSLHVIPPTTLIGALSYPLAKLMRWPETSKGDSTASRLIGIIKGVYYSILQGALIPYTEIGKIWFYKVKTKEALSDAVGIQKLYSKPQTKIKIIYIVKVSEARKLLGDEWRRILTSAAYSITRVGSKESIVSVDSIDICKIGLDGGDKTRYTVPLYNVEGIEGEYTISEVVDWRSSNIGGYFNAPTIRIAQPQGPLGSPTTVRVAPKHLMIEVCGEPVVPW